MEPVVSALGAWHFSCKCESAPSRLSETHPSSLTLPVRKMAHAKDQVPITGESSAYQPFQPPISTVCVCFL